MPKYTPPAQFRNALVALRNCHDVMATALPLEEHRARIKLVRECRDIIGFYLLCLENENENLKQSHGMPINSQLQSSHVLSEK